MVYLLALWLVLVPLFPDPEPKTPPPKADVRGKIMEIETRQGIGRLLIEGKAEKDTQHDKASVRVLATTKIYFWVDGKKKEAKADDLKKGAIVQAVFKGPVAESYPVQATAGEILILQPAKVK